MTEKMSPFRYEDEIPPEYKCGECGVYGVRLYRDYQTFSDHTRLLCTKHAEMAGSEPHKVDPERPDQIGWMVAAVPTEEGGAFWGFSSVPWRGVYWWRSLPTVADEPQSAEVRIKWLLRHASAVEELLAADSKAIDRKNAEIARLRAALRQIRDESHERGIGWTQRVANVALVDEP